MFAWSSSALGIGFTTGLIFGQDNELYYVPQLVYVGIGLMALGVIGLVIGGIIAVGEWMGRLFKKKPKPEETEPIIAPSE